MKETLCIEGPRTIAGHSLLFVSRERVAIGRHSLRATKEPLAVIIVGAQPPRVLSSDGERWDLAALRERLPELDALLATL